MGAGLFFLGFGLGIGIGLNFFGLASDEDQFSDSVSPPSQPRLLLILLCIQTATFPEMAAKIFGVVGKVFPQSRETIDNRMD